jgi:hypothetical protein
MMTYNSMESEQIVNSEKLLAVEVKSENNALSVMVAFIHIAQRRGAFTISESAKINECMNKFTRPAASALSDNVLEGSDKK